MPENKSIEAILQVAVKVNASDIHIKTFTVPVFRVNGQLIKVEELGLLKPDDLNSIMETIANEDQRDSSRSR